MTLPSLTAGVAAKAAGVDLLDPRLARPASIFAAASRGKSTRPMHTVEPLAAALGLEVCCDDSSEGPIEDLVAAALPMTWRSLIEHSSRHAHVRGRCHETDVRTVTAIVSVAQQMKVALFLKARVKSDDRRCCQCVFLTLQ